MIKWCLASLFFVLTILTQSQMFQAVASTENLFIGENDGGRCTLQVLKTTPETPEDLNAFEAIIEVTMETNHHGQKDLEKAQFTVAYLPRLNAFVEKALSNDLRRNAVVIKTVPDSLFLTKPDFYTWKVPHGNHTHLERCLNLKETRE